MRTKMLEMKRITSITLVLLALCFVSIKCDKEATDCTTGAACFPYGPMPDSTSSKDLSYYCCPQWNRTRRTARLPDGSRNCSCELDLSLESKTRKFAQKSRHQGRMCAREQDCEGLPSSSSINDRFKYCCSSADWTGIHDSVATTIFDGDKEQFIVCRCPHHSVPTPDPDAYVVPPVQMYNSTGEVCSYDEGCLDRPALKCATHWPTNVTFCCYGSRGLVTKNEGTNFTRCTCTDEVYGAQCAARPIAIADSTMACLSECSNRTAEDTCTDSSKDMRCCPNDMAVVASQSEDGNFTSCMCKTRVEKHCGTAVSFATRFRGGFNDVLLLIFVAFLLGQMWY